MATSGSRRLLVQGDFRFIENSACVDGDCAAPWISIGGVGAKLHRQRGVHPLKCLEEYASGAAPQDAFRAARLMVDWEHKFADEMKFRREYGPPGLRRGQPAGAHRGVLPYSTHRESNWRWQSAYQEMILPQFDSGEYRARVTAHLSARETAQNPAPVFVGLLATVRDGEPRLSAEGWSAWQRMQLAVGAERVQMRAVRLRATTGARVILEGWTPLIEHKGRRRREASRDHA